MKSAPVIFVDSDVIISSLISSSGAAYLLLNTAKLDFFISDISYKELKIVAERLKLSLKDLNDLITRRLNIVRLKLNLKKIKTKYGVYAIDINDAHVVAGAVGSQANFLVSYNLKHFRLDKIKADLNIIVLPPALFLQYLRS